MSETELDDERGESYLEIQMDRSTIVLAVLGLLAVIAASFLLGSWFGSRSAAKDVAAADGATTGGEAETEATPPEHDGEAVVAEDGFGGKAVTAKGAPPVRGVPAPRETASLAPPPGPSEPAGDPASGDAARATAPKASSPKASAPRATAAPKAAPRATAAPKAASRATAAPKAASAPKPTAAPQAVAASSPSGAGWIIQVAAVKVRSEADALASRLQRKGYPVRVVDEAGLVKVQVGPYDSKPEAQAAEQRLKREEKVGTWLKRG